MSGPRRIAVLTTTRADYGLLRELIRLLHSDSAITLQLIVSGTHLMPVFGMTVQEIEGDEAKRRL